MVNKQWNMLIESQEFFLLDACIYVLLYWLLYQIFLCKSAMIMLTDYKGPYLQ